jgi:hypothetical protein
LSRRWYRAAPKRPKTFYDEAKKLWVAEPGRFEVQAGSSSRDIRLKAEFELAR